MIAFQAAIKQKELATAQSTFQVVRTFSQTLSLIIGQVKFQSQVTREVAALSNIPQDLMKFLASGNAVAAISKLRRLPAPQQALVRQALTTSINRMWIFYTAVSIAALIASLFLRKIELSRTHEEVKTGLPSQEVHSTTVQTKNLLTGNGKVA